MVIIFTDTIVLLGALRKGRSRSLTLNGIYKSIAYLEMVGDLTIKYFYMPSAYNPADSRPKSYRTHRSQKEDN